MTVAALQQLLAEIDTQGGPAAARANRLDLPESTPPAAATVRAWARRSGVDCPRTGHPPRAVVDAWRAAGAPTS